jgi:hypothetical protein
MCDTYSAISDSQEPNERQPAEGNNFSAATNGNAKPCIYARNYINALPLLDLCSTDATMVRMTYTRGGSCEDLITSASLPYDSDEPSPTRELRTSSTTAATG